MSIEMISDILYILQCHFPLENILKRDCRGSVDSEVKLPHSKLVHLLIV